MKRLVSLFLPAVFWASLGWAGTALPAPTVTDATIHAYFSPTGGSTEAVVEALGQARTTVKVQAYSPSPPPQSPRPWWMPTSAGCGWR